jgi:hypothetical protein
LKGAYLAGQHVMRFHQVFQQLHRRVRVGVDRQVVVLVPVKLPSKDVKWMRSKILVQAMRCVPAAGLRRWFRPF